jgi:hypothetical protein
VRKRFTRENLRVVIPPPESIEDGRRLAAEMEETLRDLSIALDEARGALQSAGGRGRADKLRHKRSGWQKVVTEIRAQKPGLSGLAVARLVQKRLRLESPSARQIARYIQKALK